jgi:hypothetical protein
LSHRDELTSVKETFYSPYLFATKAFNIVNFVSMRDLLKMLQHFLSVSHTCNWVVKFIFHMIFMYNRRYLVLFAFICSSWFGFLCLSYLVGTLQYLFFRFLSLLLVESHWKTMGCKLCIDKSFSKSIGCARYVMGIIVLVQIGSRYVRNLCNFAILIYWVC